MNNIFKKILESYKLGFRWATYELDEAFFLQIAYIGLIIIELITLYKIDYPNVSIYVYMMILHLISMYIIGYIKNLHEGSILEGSHAEEYLQRAYFLLNAIILVLTMLITKSCMALILIITQTIGATLIIGLCFFIIQAISIISRNAHFAYEHIEISMIILYSFTIAPVAIAIASMPIFIAWKLIILIAFVISIPLIVFGADNGMNFFDLFFHM